MRLSSALTILSLPILLGSCGLINSALQVPGRIIRPIVRTLSDAQDQTPPATREAENAAQIALKSH